MNNFDIVIPVGPNDIDIVNLQIEYTKKNIIGYRNIYIISHNSNLCVKGCIMINENIFPFNIEYISSIFGKNNRNGWYLQQLLKLYSGIVIPGILEKYLVIDTDTIFLKPTEFINDGKCMYNYGTEYHRPYFEHMKKLDPTLVRVNNVSGICHHMMFETKYIIELFKKIENIHGEKFYDVFLKCVSDITGSGASEYEIYFNYMLINHKDKIIIRKLNWENVKKLDLSKNLDYISYHHYNR